MPDWETLKKLTGSRFAQHVILVPIVGWLLVYQNAFATMVSKVLGVEFQAELGWEVLVFYVGLVLLGISASVFRIVGPEPVLNHNGLQGFTEDTEAILTRKGFSRFCEEAGILEPVEIRVPGSGIGQVLDATREQWFRLNSEGIRDVLSEHYKAQNLSKSLVRSATTLVFAAGACLTLVPTGITVLWVLGQLLGRSYSGS